MAEQTAAQWAHAQVARVRDSPAQRRALARHTYGGPTGRAPDHLPFRRAQVAFTEWQVRRGVLNAPGDATPGSAWWRVVNERLLRDGCEAVARAAGRGGAVSSPSVDMWMDFVASPTAATWYRAHNSSIVAGYLDHLELALRETETERFFLNVVLLRVLYAHAMISHPRLALSWMSPLSPVLGDPRVRMTGLFLSISRVLPETYPLREDVRENVRRERGVGRLLDYGVIGPRLPDVYAWSAEILDEPRLRALIGADGPCYALPGMRDVWYPARTSVPVRIVRRVLPLARPAAAG